MEFRNNNIRKIIVAIIFVLIIGITIAGPRLVSSNSRIANVVGTVISPVSNFFRNVGLTINSGLKKAFKIEEDTDITNLRVKIAILEDENRKLNDVIARADALKREYKLLNSTNRNLVEAKIVSRSPGAWYDIFKIDKGSRQGLLLNDTVVVASGEEGEAIEGLVGKITEIGFDYANVTTIQTDNNKVAVRNLRSGDGGIITGMQNGLLEGYMYDRNSDVIVGDTIMTSGMGEIYKDGIFVGIVEKVENDETNLKKNIFLKPAVDPKNLRRVYVVK